MAFTRIHKSGSPLQFCLIILLVIAFLAPLYHSHGHAADHHPEGSDDLVFSHDGSGNDRLAAAKQHNDSHLHIKKLIGRTDDHLRFKSRSLTPDLCALTEAPVVTKDFSCTFIKHVQASIFQSNSYDCLSGLSPPVA